MNIELQAEVTPDRVVAGITPILAAERSEFRRRRRKPRSIVGTLAFEAALRGRIGVEPLAVDALAAVDANAIDTRRDAAQGRIDLADLFHFAGELREIHIDEQVGDRLLFGIVDLSGELPVGLRIAPEQRLADSRLQRPQARAQADLAHGNVQVRT